MKYYSANMNDGSRMLAGKLGIAAGWIDNEVFKVGCEICEFECGGLLTSGMSKLYGDSAAARVTNQVWDRFRSDAMTMNCKHLGRYDFCISNPGEISSLPEIGNGD